jgi:hypothetical protein
MPAGLFIPVSFANLQLAFSLRRKGERLEIDRAPQRHDQPAALLQLFDERRRDVICRGRDDDGVKGRVPVSAETT